jgi:tetratricopeptide (TPR) repeat protein
MQDVPATLAAAVACVERGELDAAEELSRSVLRADPLSPRALHVLGVVARKTDRLQLAIAVLQDAARLNPDDAGIHCELGLALSDSRREDEAVAHYRRAIEIDPHYGDACLNLAAALDRLEQFEAALPWACRAAELLPNNPIAHFNLGNVWRQLGNLEEASAEFRSAIGLDPSFASAHWNDACCRLLAGDFATGWREYEWREKAGEVSLDHYPQPLWNGESLERQTILVHSEQGIGDEILFASCFPDLIAWAGHCILVCEPRLEKLFARSFPLATVHGIARRKDRIGTTPTEKIDKQIPAGSLPLYLRPTRESFPRRQSFLTADSQAKSKWRERLDGLGPGLKIGISWRAGGQPSERRKRTTGLEHWRNVFSVAGVHFINLQYGESADEIAAVEREFGVVVHDWNDADPLVDLDGFAAEIAALDLVISVGNATVHLAGALGVPCWTLLPKVPGWRWMIDGDQSIWYRSVHLVRQSERGQWQPVFDAVAAMLADAATSGDPHTTLTCGGTHHVSPARRLAGGEGANGSSRQPSRVGGARNGTEAVPYNSHRQLNRVLPADRNASAPPQFDAVATFDSASRAFERGDLAVAEASCRRVLDHMPRHAPALNLLGQIARRTGRLDLAIRTLVRAVAAADQNPLVQLNLASAQHEAGDLPAAIESYGRAIAMDSKLADGHFGLGKALRAIGRHAEAIAALEETVRRQPNHHKALNRLGGGYLETGRWTDAERAFRAAVNLRPDYMAAHNNLGMALERQGRLPEALACFDRALELDERCLQAANNLAGVLNRLGQHSVATLVQNQSVGLRAAG